MAGHARPGRREDRVGHAAGEDDPAGLDGVAPGREVVRGEREGLAGVALGIALAKLSGGSLAAVVAIVLALICFVLFRMRTGR